MEYGIFRYRVEYYVCAFQHSSAPIFGGEYDSLIHAKDEARSIIRQEKLVCSRYDKPIDLRYARVIDTKNKRIIWECEFWGTRPNREVFNG